MEDRDKSLYFRKVAVAANDDDKEASVCFPSSSIHRIQVSGTNVNIHFKTIQLAQLSGVNPDLVVLPCSTTAKAEGVAEKILNAINYGEDGVIIVVVNVTETYLSEDCDDITSITIDS